MRRFKIGDKVRIARIADKYLAKAKNAVEKWKSMLGDEYVIIAYAQDDDGSNGYDLDTDGSSFWLDEELEPCKETQVLEILRQWKQSSK